jgi:hypothetical protein
MGTELVTPGHPPPLDTLIVMGIAVGVLRAHPAASIEVKKQGSSYRITIDIDGQITWDRVYEALSEKMLFEVERLSYGWGSLYSAFGPQRGIKPKDLSGRFEELVELARKDFPKIAQEYSEQSQHAAREGRSWKRKKLYTAYLPIAPWAGKYFAGTYEYREEPYTLCPLCSFLAWSGILSSSSVITYVAEGKRGTVYAVPDPIRVRDYDLALLALVFAEKKGERRLRNDIPLLAAPLLILASGETVWPIRGEYGLYVWKYEGAGNFLGIKGFAQLPLSPLLEFVARAKARGKYLPRLIGYLASRKGDPSLIALITECLAYGEPDPYTVVRSIWSLLSRAKDERERRVLRWLDRGVAEGLFEVWKKYWEGHRAGGTPSSATTVAGTGSWT